MQSEAEKLESGVTRICRHCGETKLLKTFPLHSKGMPRSICYECYLAAARVRELKRRTDEGKVRLRKQRRAIVITDQKRERERRHTRLYREKYPEKERAKRVVKAAIARGELIRPCTCQECGEVNPTRRDGVTSIQAHHDDYSRPLDVRWLCVVCHAKEHKDDLNRSLSPTQPEAKEAHTDAWPNGCHSPSSCSRHMACMYTNCRHENRSIKAEIEAALKAKEARDAS